MTELESLLETAQAIENRPGGETVLSALNLIAQLMNEFDTRESRATYNKKFHLGKIDLTVDFDGRR